MANLCVFCGSRSGANPSFSDAARAVGERLAATQAGLVYGGGSVGLMGVVAEAAFSGGAEVLGVIPGGLFEREMARERVTELIVTGSMHERKAKMVARSDAFLALPGGAGTLDELFEVFTWRQIGIHAKPIGVLNIAGFFDGILSHMAAATEAGFIRPEDRERLLVFDDPDLAVETLLGGSNG